MCMSTKEVMEIPTHLKGKEISLEHIGSNGVAWHRSEVFQLIEYLESSSKFILGGDFLTLEEGKYRHNYDNWHFSPDDGDFKDSIEHNKKYID